MYLGQVMYYGTVAVSPIPPSKASSTVWQAGVPLSSHGFYQGLLQSVTVFPTGDSHLKRVLRQVKQTAPKVEPPNGYLSHYGKKSEQVLA